MFEQLSGVTGRLEEIIQQLSRGGAALDPDTLCGLMKEQARLTPIADTYKQYEEAAATIADCEEMLETERDEDMRKMMRDELAEAKAEEERLSYALRVLLLPKDPCDEKNVVVEIRAGVGGDEAALFAAQMFRMYSRYADRKGWKVELTSVSENGPGGFRECVFLINGKGAYSRLKYESGVHRVQRVPETESGGRIHTSACTVAIMPQADEIDFHLDLKDCKFDVFRSSGNGGQSVNTTDSAVRLTHLPTGIVVSCQDEKSQLKNKDKALKILRSILYQKEVMERHDAEDAERRIQIGSGDRSEKIRTYNFPQGRVTDHRIKLTVHRIDEIMDGDLDMIIDNLIAADQASRLSNGKM